MDRQFLGKEIKRIREELNLTQKQISNGICDQGVISKIERGEFFPSFEVLLALSNRLKLPINYFFEAAISGQFHHVNSVKNEVDTLLTQFKFQDVYLLADSELQTNEFLLGEHRQFLIWARATSAFYAKILTYDECSAIIEKCITEEIDYINQNQKMRIRNSLANMKASIGKFEESFVEYERLISEFKSESNTFLYVQILFNYANNLHSYGQVEKALEIVNKALILCRTVENLRLFGMLYFLKGECLIDMRYPRQTISGCFKKAFLSFEELDHQKFIGILKDHYSDYI
ncbi:MAG: PlcR [Bacillales bacterium]|jgi:transcriptional regulator with XRE-family HTH domain|nr:PlcR [Bacillales bacterium]